MINFERVQQLKAKAEQAQEKYNKTLKIAKENEKNRIKQSEEYQVAEKIDNLTNKLLKLQEDTERHGFKMPRILIALETKSRNRRYPNIYLNFYVSKENNVEIELLLKSDLLLKPKYMKIENGDLCLPTESIFYKIQKIKKFDSILAIKPEDRTAEEKNSIPYGWNDFLIPYKAYKEISDKTDEIYEMVEQKIEQGLENEYNYQIKKAEEGIKKLENEEISLD